MTNCEMCGETFSYSPITIKVAGSNMKVCNNCKSTGNVVNSSSNQKQSHTFRYNRKSTNMDLDIVEDFQKKVNSALAKKKLNIQQLARMLNIKESTLNKYFTGKIKPDIETAKKLENFFEIDLVIESGTGSFDINSVMDDDDDTTSRITIGDLMKGGFKK